MRLCIAPGCTRKHTAKGYCQLHYIRFLRHGAADVIHKRGPTPKLTSEQRQELVSLVTVPYGQRQRFVRTLCDRFHVSHSTIYRALGR